MARDSSPPKIIFIKFLWVILCLGIIFSAVRAFSHEYRSAVMVRSFDADVIDGLREFDAANTPVTVRGLGELMVECANLLLSNAVLLLDDALSGEVALSCAQAADHAIAENPAFAGAHAAALVAKAATFTPQDYRLAQAAAPFEPWPLGIRILAMERRLIQQGTVDESLSPLFADDVARAVQSDWGRRMLASLYMRRPALQGVILTAIEGRPEGDQAAFLRAVRNLTRR